MAKCVVQLWLVFVLAFIFLLFCYVLIVHVYCANVIVLFNCIIIIINLIIKLSEKNADFYDCAARRLLTLR